jgi:hypothetical protein
MHSDPSELDGRVRQAIVDVLVENLQALRGICEDNLYNGGFEALHEAYGIDVVRRCAIALQERVNEIEQEFELLGVLGRDADG